MTSQQDSIMGLTNSQLTQIQIQTRSNRTCNSKKSPRPNLFKITSLTLTSVTKRLPQQRTSRISSSSKTSKQTSSISQEDLLKGNLSNKSRKSSLRMPLTSSMTLTLVFLPNLHQYSNSRSRSSLQDYLVSINQSLILSNKLNNSKTYLELHSSLVTSKPSNQYSKSSSNQKNLNSFQIWLDSIQTQ